MHVRSRVHSRCRPEALAGAMLGAPPPAVAVMAAEIDCTLLDGHPALVPCYCHAIAMLLPCYVLPG